MKYIKSPLRVSLFGGGTDFADYFQNNRGKVIGFAINRFVNVFGSNIELNQDFILRLSYRINEEVNNLSDIKHPIYRTILQKYKMNDPYHFMSFSSLPSNSGLGSSSSFTVGIVAILKSIFNEEISANKIAREAIDIERNLLNESGGWQDQLHSAYRGINCFDFHGNDFTQNKINLSSENLDILDSSSYLLYTGLNRDASNIEKSKMQKLGESELNQIYQIACEGEKCMLSDKLSLMEIGQLLNENWKLKKSLSSQVSNNLIDEMYESIIKEGAFGAKICGAGGGGFFYLLAEDHIADKIKSKFSKAALIKIKTFDDVINVEDI